MAIVTYRYSGDGVVTVTGERARGFDCSDPIGVVDPIAICFLTMTKRSCPAGSTTVKYGSWSNRVPLETVTYNARPVHTLVLEGIIEVILGDLSKNAGSMWLLGGVLQLPEEGRIVCELDNVRSKALGPATRIEWNNRPDFSVRTIDFRKLLRKDTLCIGPRAFRNNARLDPKSRAFVEAAQTIGESIPSSLNDFLDNFNHAAKKAEIARREAAKKAAADKRKAAKKAEIARREAAKKAEIARREAAKKAEADKRKATVEKVKQLGKRFTGIFAHP